LAGLHTPNWDVSVEEKGGRFNDAVSSPLDNIYGTATSTPKEIVRLTRELANAERHEKELEVQSKKDKLLSSTLRKEVEILRVSNEGIKKREERYRIERDTLREQIKAKDIRDGTDDETYEGQDDEYEEPEFGVSMVGEREANDRER